MSLYTGTTMYHGQFPTWSIIWGVVEMSTMLFIYGTYLLNVCLVISLIIPTMALTFYLLIIDCNKRSIKSQYSICYSFFLGQYYNVIQLLLKSNDSIIYGIIGIVLVYNLPIHAYIATYLTTFSIMGTRKALFLIILLIQTFGFIFLLSLPAIVNKNVVSIRKSFEAFLQCMGQNVRIKWKYLTYMEFLQSKPQVGYTLFPYGAITFKLIIEV